LGTLEEKGGAIMSKTHLLNNPTKAKDMEESTLIKALLVGKSKSGKSTSATTIPGRKLVIDTDLRGDAYAGFDNIDIIRVDEPDLDKPQAWNNIVTLREDIWEEINAKTFPYDGIIWDGLSSLSRYAMNQALQLRDSMGKLMGRGPGGGPAQPHYLPQMNEMSKHIFNCIAMPVHVVFTGHYYVYEDEKTNQMDWLPKMIGNIRTEVGSWFNETYACYRDGSKPENMKYVWQTFPDRKLDFIGSTLNKFGKLWKDPVEINFDELPTGFEALLAKRHEGR
jgi:hypothetical protein